MRLFHEFLSSEFRINGKIIVQKNTCIKILKLRVYIHFNQNKITRKKYVRCIPNIYGTLEHLPICLSFCIPLTWSYYYYCYEN